MSTITVRFTGICTHIKFMDIGGNIRHRVVLIRADHGAYLKNAAIPPHIATLRIDPAFIEGIDGYPYGLETLGPVGAWRMAGVALSLEGGTDSFTRDASFELLPHLGTESKAPLPDLAREVTERGQAAAYFDINGGRLSASQAEKGAPINAQLQVETTEPGLRVTCIWNRQSSLIRLRPGAVIDVEHTGYAHGESDQDFLLHYRVLTSVPDDAEVPPEEKNATAKPPGDIRVGCSNSQYP